MTATTNRRAVRLVTADEVAAYRRVTRLTLPDGAVDGTPVASPIHPVVLAWKAFDHAVGDLTAGSYTTVVHLSQEIRQRRPVQPGETVTVDLDIVGARRDPRGVRLVLGCRIAGDHDGGGAPFASLSTGLLVVDATQPEPFGDVPALPAPSGSGWAATVTRSVPVDLPRRYADASGDYNALHLDDAAARAAGFPGVIAHGMSVFALACEEAVEHFLGGDAGRVRALGCRFSSPVAPGDTVAISLGAGGEPGQARFACRTERGVAVKNGWMTWGPA